MKTTLDKLKVGQTFKMSNSIIKVISIDGDYLYYKFLYNDISGILYVSGMNDVELIGIKDNKLNRKLHPKYKEKDGYLYE